MWLKKVFRNESMIPGAGYGLVAAEPIVVGEIVANFLYNVSSSILMNEYDHLHDSSRILQRTGARWIADRMLFTLSESDDDLVNHSWEPNLLYFFGTLLARRAIFPGDELTVDYRLILSPNDPGSFRDQSGLMVTGLPVHEALYMSVNQYLDLIGADPQNPALSFALTEVEGLPRLPKQLPGVSPVSAEWPPSVGRS